MEIKTFNRKDLMARGWTPAQIKDFPVVATVKTGKPGRPARLYSVEAVEAAETERAANQPVAQAQPETTNETVSAPVVETETVQADQSVAAAA